MNGASLPRFAALLPHLLLVMAMAFFGAAIVLGRYVQADVPPVGMMFWRAAVSVVVVAPFLVGRTRREFGAIKRHWKLMFALGLAQAVTGQVPVFAGLHDTTAINAGLITATQPALILLLVWMFGGERLGVRQLLGLIAAFSGTVVIVARGDAGALARLDLSLGDLWVQIGIASWAVYSVLVRTASVELSPSIIFLGMSVTSVLVLAPLYLGEMLVLGLYVRFDAATVATILFLAVFASVLALVFLAIGIRALGSSRSGMYNYLVPVFTALMAALRLGEELELFHLLGFALISGGVFFATRR